MSNQKENAIKQFFKSVEDLKRLKVIRSDKYLGDIGEFICSEVLDIKLTDSKREKGYDGFYRDQKCQIKYHNSQTRTNIYFGNPDEYEIAFVVLGDESCLWRNREKDTFNIYKFSSQVIKDKFKRLKGFSCGIRVFDEKAPIATYELITS